jgi:putative membrane protein
MKILLKYDKRIIIFLVIFYAVGIAGMLIPASRKLFISLTPINLIMNLLLLFLFHEGRWEKLILPGIAIYLAGYLVELAGVNTGIIFGEYSYGEVLGPKLFDTPLMIGVNWLILVYAVWAFVRKVKASAMMKYLLAALLMMLYDLFLEPSAISMGMWSWVGEGIPLQNYLAWFIISFGMFIFLDLTLRDYKNKIASAVFTVQLMFFLILDIITFWF